MQNIITLKEYSNDYASNNTEKEIGRVMINEIDKIPNEKVKNRVKKVK